MSRRAQRTPARVALLVTLAVLLVAALVVGDTAREQGATATTGEPDLPSEATRSATWYCAEGTSSPDGRADETVIVTNLGVDALDAQVTVLPGGDQPIGTSMVSVAPRSRVEVRVADVLATPEPGVVVETFGGDAFVEHELRNGDDVALGPCADAAASEWRFASGSTVPGAQQHLALFNPFPDDASVDVSFLTDTGYQAPESLQGLTVPRRSRLTVAVHDVVARQTLVASTVSVRTGRIVAEQALVRPGGDGDALAVTLGSTSARTEWWFAIGTPTLTIANPAAESTEVEVTHQLDGDLELEPQVVTIPPRAVTVVDFTGRVAADVGYAVRVQTRRGARVVVEETTTGPGGGLASTVGSVRLASRWAFSEVRPVGGSQGELTVYNPGDDPVRVTAVVVADGTERRPRDRRDLEVAPGERVRIPVDAFAANSAVVLEATAPVFAARLVYDDDGAVTLSPGVRA